MKYFVLIPDGMADEKVAALGNMTPMEKAAKPTIDTLARLSYVGTVSNVPSDMVPESDTANLAILSYDPKIYSKGRSPLEAVSMGLDMKPDETAYRCNVVTLSDEGDYDEKIMIDHSADEITTAEADLLIKSLDEQLGNDIRKFYTGVSYRHCLLWKNGDDKYPFMRPHDILGQPIKEYLPSKEDGKEFYDLMRRSYDILNHHPVNEERRRRGLRPANSAWLWSPGKKPALPSFKEKWGLDAAVISAVDLIWASVFAPEWSRSTSRARPVISPPISPAKPPPPSRRSKKVQSLYISTLKLPTNAGTAPRLKTRCFLSKRSIARSSPQFLTISRAAETTSALWSFPITLPLCVYVLTR